MRRSWAGHLAGTRIVRNLHRIVVGRAKKEIVSEDMALFGSAVFGQRQALRDITEPYAFLNARFVQTLQSDTPMVTVPLVQCRGAGRGLLEMSRVPLLILTQIYPSLCYENSSHSPSWLVFSTPYLSSCLCKNVLAFCPPYHQGAHQLKV